MTSKSPGRGWGWLIAIAMTAGAPAAWAGDPAAPEQDKASSNDPADAHGPKAGDTPPPEPTPEAAPEPQSPEPAPEPDAENVQRALSLHDEAKQLYARGQYPEAIAKLEEAAELDPSAIVLHYNLGLIEEKMGHLDRALVHFRRTLDLEKNPREQQHLAKVIKRIEGAKALDVLGRPPVPRPGHPAKPTLGPDVPPDPHPSSGPSSLEIAAYATGGGALLLFATASVLFVRAADLDPDDARTGDGVTIDQLERDADAAHRHAIGADVLFGVGAVSAVTSLVLGIVVGTGSDDEEPPPAVAFGLGPTGGSLTWRF